MSRVDEALGRAAALAGTQPGTSLRSATTSSPGRRATSGRRKPRLPTRTSRWSTTSSRPPRPWCSTSVRSRPRREADEKLVSRLLDSRSVEQYRHLAARLHLVAGATRHQGGHDQQRASGRRQDAHGGEHRAHAEPLLQAARAPDRRRPAPPLGARALPGPERQRPQRRHPLAERRRRFRSFAGPSASRCSPPAVRTPTR